MKRFWLGMMSLMVVALVFCAPGKAQEPPAMGSGKKLPPGILTTIPADPQPAETFTLPRPIVELLANPTVPTWKPNYSEKGAEDVVHKGATLRELAKDSIFRRSIWNLEYSFKPLRMIDVDLPQPNGKMQRKKLWYSVYKVKNNGYHLGLKLEEDAWKHKTVAIDKINQNIYFFPHFVLRAMVRKPGTTGGGAENYMDKEYLDRVIPAAMKPIAERERIGVKLYDSVSISKVPIPVSDSKNDRSVWGVAIWEDVDPHVDFCSIFIQGLTNAYEFVDPPGGYKAGDPPGTGRTFTTKTLQINFWRPGDAVLGHEAEIRYGIPLDTDPSRQQELLEIYGVTSPLDYLWMYR